MYTRAREILRRARRADGFGMVELLCAMTVLSLGILALFAMFESGMTQLRRASAVTTAAAIADTEMEGYRAIKFDVIGLDDSDVAATDALYKADTAYRDETTPATTLAAGLDSGSATVTVGSAAGFPTAPPFRVEVGSEVMLVEAVSGTTWTVKRGSDGTVASAHASGVAVTQKKLAHVVRCGTGTCTHAVPTKTVTGADGRSYRVDTYMTWNLVSNATAVTGRNVKLVTIVVRGSATGRVYARVSSSFDESTGQ